MCKIEDALKDPAVKESLQRRLKESLLFNPTNGCSEWTKTATFNNGYGKISTTREIGPVRAHRLAWILEHGPIPDEFVLLHSCDNPKCCNTEHLRVGTRKENTKDMLDRKRHFTPFIDMEGEGNSRATISEEIAKKIIIAEGKRKEIASIFGTTYKVVCDIKQRKSWRYLHEK